MTTIRLQYETINFIVSFFFLFFQYTNYGGVTDFYKVESMRGTYLSGRMNSGEYSIKYKACGMVSGGGLGSGRFSLLRK